MINKFIIISHPYSIFHFRFHAIYLRSQFNFHLRNFSQLTLRSIIGTRSLGGNRHSALKNTDTINVPKRTRGTRKRVSKHFTKYRLFDMVHDVVAFDSRSRVNQTAGKGCCTLDHHGRDEA